MQTRKTILAWLFPLGAMAAVILGALIVRGQPRFALGAILGVMLVVPVVWVAVSALWPATADRNCPGCGGDTVVRIDPDSTVGLRCTSCDWRDEAASAWLLAEEEGPLEDVVLRQRARKKGKRRRSVVDSSGRSD